MRLLISLIITIVFLQFGQTQLCDYRVEYVFSYVVDTTSMEHGSPEKYILYKQDSNSRFLSSARNYNDSINEIFKATKPNPLETSANPSDSDVQSWVDDYIQFKAGNHKKLTSKLATNKDLTSDELTVSSMVSYPARYFREVVVLSWEILNEKEVIGGITCMKATTVYSGRQYTAWFAPTIPISDGPYVFSGLPGLILRLEDEKGWYLFEITSLNLVENACYWDKDFEYSGHIKLSKEEYGKWLAKQKYDPDVAPGLQGDRTEARLRLKKKRKTSYDLLIEGNFD